MSKNGLQKDSMVLESSEHSALSRKFSRKFLLDVQNSPRYGTINILRMNCWNPSFTWSEQEQQGEERKRFKQHCERGLTRKAELAQKVAKIAARCGPGVDTGTLGGNAGSSLGVFSPHTSISNILKDEKERILFKHDSRTGWKKRVKRSLFEHRYRKSE